MRNSALLNWINEVDFWFAVLALLSMSLIDLYGVTNGCSTPLNTAETLRELLLRVHVS